MLSLARGGRQRRHGHARRLGAGARTVPRRRRARDRHRHPVRPADHRGRHRHARALRQRQPGRRPPARHSAPGCSWRCCSSRCRSPCARCSRCCSTSTATPSRPRRRSARRPATVFRRIVLPQILPAGAVRGGAVLRPGHRRVRLAGASSPAASTATRSRRRIIYGKLQDADNPGLRTQQAGAIAFVLLARERRSCWSRSTSSSAGWPVVTDLAARRRVAARHPDRGAAADGRRRPGTGLRALAVVYVGLLVLLPVVVLCYRTFEPGLAEFLDALQRPRHPARVPGHRDRRGGRGRAQHRVRRRHRDPAGALPSSRGKRLLDAFIDLPVAVSPIVVGLALLLVYGPQRLVRLDRSGQADFIGAKPGMILATTFVSLPLVVRAVVPVLVQAGARAGPGRGLARRQRRTCASGASRCRRSAPPSPTAWCWPWPAASASTARSWSCPTGASPGQTETAPCASATTSRPTRTRRRLRGGVRAHARRHRRHPDRGADPPPGKGLTWASRSSDIGKRFGDFVALDDVSCRCARARSPRCSARAAAASRRCCASSPVSRAPTPARCSSTARTRPRCRRGTATSASCSSTTPRSAPVGVPQRRLRPRDPQAAQGRDPQAGHRAARAGAPRAVRRPAAGAAVRRPAPAHGPGPRARRRAQGAAARRAVRRARRQGAQGAARLAAPPARRGARDDGVRHPRPGRGPRGLGRDRRHQPRAASSRSAPPTSSTTSRPTTS